MPADEQSVLPGMRGVPWWGAILIGAGTTAVGATIDALVNSSLGLLYNVFYLIGCVAAVLAVRRRALFTAAVQPPLITLIIGLFSLYGLVLANGDASKPQGMRSAVLNIALPFSNLFPWILGTFVITLLIAAVRWFVTRGDAGSDRTASRATGGSRPRGAKPGRKSGTGKAAAAKAGAPAGASRKGGSAKSGATRSSKSASAKSASAKSGAAKSGAAKSGSPKSGSAKSGPPKAAAPSPRGPKAGGSKPGAPKAERTRAATAEKRPRPAPARPADEAPARATPERVSSPRGEPRPVRRTQSPVTQGRDRPVRRAQPQVIPPRPRPTAGEQLRGQGAVEDLASGLDD
ncbi:hypothetical protein GCM10022231_16950 [Gordonia caeni]|uniref:DUF6542 domain-containing protein n=1 Tax=Gordonia caeni TaxID=1007097 RepID=A0ABP7P1N7_9ACTN